MTIPLCRVIDRGPNKTCAACCPINGDRTLLVPCSRSAGSPVDAGTDHGEWAARIDVRGAQLSVQALAARGESLAAFDGRGIPKPPQRGCRVGDPEAPRPSRCDARLSPRAVSFRPILPARPGTKIFKRQQSKPVAPLAGRADQRAGLSGA